MLKRLKNLFKIAKLLSADDSTDIRSAIVSTFGKQQRVAIYTPYGVMHNPPVGSLVTLWSQQAQESNGVGIADDPANRTLKNLAPGEIAVGNYLTGDYVVFKDGSIVELVTGGTLRVIAPQVSIESSDISITATTSLAITSPDVNIIGASLTHNGTNVGDTHTHEQKNDSDGSKEQDTEAPK